MYLPKNIDELVSGGIAELLSERYWVTNISVKDDFNLGSSLRLREHLQTHSYDKILVCQNDPLKDLGLLKATDLAWRSQFAFTIDQLVAQEVNTISKLVEFLLNLFYKEIADAGATHVFAGPTRVNTALAQQHGLVVVDPSWTECLVPGAVTSVTESYLDTAAELLLDLFPANSRIIKQEFIAYSDAMFRMFETWRQHPNLFAYHHPTALGNQIFYQRCLQNF